MPLSQFTTESISLPNTPLRRDYFVAAAICLLGFFLRAWNFSQLGLTHFDEGASAWSAFWTLHKFAGPTLYPWQKLFSPPGYFGLVGIAYWLSGGPSALAAIFINILAGTATVVLVWWSGCRWFGRRAGLFSAALVASSEFQIAFSRTALTDTLFAFFFLLALAIIAVCMECDRPAFALLAGLAAGAAWNVKYHGWLALAIAAAVIALALLIGKVERAKTKRFIFQWGLMAAVAVACFLPWFLQVQIHMGGYGEVEAFHGKFLDFHWISNFVRQAQEQIYFEGWLSRLAPVFAFLLAWLLHGKIPEQRWKFIALVSVALLLSGMAVGGAGTWTWLAAFGLREAWKKGRFFGQLLTVGFFVFFIVEPFYALHTGLYLPWILIAQLLAGASFNSLFPLNSQRDQVFSGLSEKLSTRFFAGAAALFAIFIFTTGARIKSNEIAWASTTSSRDAAQQLMTQIPSDATVFVVGEPQLAFYFRSAGYHTYCLHYLAFNQIAPDPIMYALSNRGPIYVVGGYYARDEYNWRRILAAVSYRFQAVDKIPMTAGDIQLLDDFSPREAAAYKSNPDGRYDLDLLVMNHDKLK